MSVEYSIQIIWSSEDGAYLAFPAELAGCMADGQTPEEALANLKVVIKEWLEVAKEQCRPIPNPMTIQDFALLQQKEMQAQQQQIQTHIRNEVEKIVNQLVSKFVTQQQTVHAFAGLHGRVIFQDPEELEIAGGHKHR
jgi:predicted RNase H-like HicB family nuclease